ncbi:ATP-binding protein [Gorillibacterium timonense]|uniref:ATP-binding protein n=1 Tax=Gorillibacterium timonense TaxID=1689269 RepID=UPI000AEFF91D|nr:ATP-binding protein [Gorillibacterium timonense]
MEVVRQFDLNIEKVLEHWNIAFALREIIANAFDEHMLTKTIEPKIYKDEQGAWHIRDYGRGLRYEHFTQNENKEKLKNPELVIGKFGVGLKDALATFDRKKVHVLIRSRHADISMDKSHKHGFEDIVTLHAVVHPPSDPNFIGTDVILIGIKDEDMYQAKDFFLHFSGDEVLETLPYGSVLKPKKNHARIYVNGLYVAEEENFLFSYNITSLNAALRKALNRERTNVGRSAYTDRVKSILLSCSSSSVADKLAADLKNFETGHLHDELQWTDVQIHACKILNANEIVIFLTPDQLRNGGALVTHAQNDGHRIVVVPDSIAHRLGNLQDIQGQPILDLAGYRTEFNNSFEFRIVSLNQLSKTEQDVLAVKDVIINWLPKSQTQNIKEIRISETMRVDYMGNEALGLWEPLDQRITIKRSQLGSVIDFSGTLLHEITHAFTGADDESMEFEQGLTQLLGQLTSYSLKKESTKGFWSLFRS